MNKSSALYFTDHSNCMHDAEAPSGEVGRLGRDDNILPKHGTDLEEALVSTKLPEACEDNNNNNSFQDDSPTDFDHANPKFVMTNSDDRKISQDKTSNKSPFHTTKQSTPEDFDTLVHRTQIALNQKLENNKIWAQKLLAEVASYSKTLSEVHTEYARTQELEHQEGQRLDLVEPDVHGATSQVLDNAVASVNGFDSFQKSGSGELADGGSKRRLGQD
jgi:hypothetical protein